MNKQLQYSRIYNFKKFGRYFTFKKDFYDERHESNYVDLMMNKGYNFIGVFYVDDKGEATTEAQFKDNLYIDKNEKTNN